MKIEIKWLYDDYDCDICGPNWAQGAVVKFEDGRILDLSPNAHCYNTEDYDIEKVLRRIIEELGHEIVSV